MTHADPPQPHRVTAPVSPTDVLRRFVREAPTALAMFDTEMRYVAASERWRRIFDISDVELEGRSHYEIFPDLPERWIAVHRRGLEGVVERCDEDRWDGPDGTHKWFRWEVRPWFNEAGAIGGITIFTDEITQRIESHRALVESERRLRFALDASNAGTWTLDLTTDIVTWDERARSFFGFGTAAGDPLADLLTRFPASYQVYKRRRIQEIQDDVQQNDWDELIELRRPDGGVGWVHALGRVERDESGRAVRVSGIIFDVTEQQRADESLRLALGSASATAWTWRLDSDTGFIDERGRNSFKVPAGTAIPREAIQRHVHPDDSDYVRRVMDRVRDENGDGWDIEYRVLARDGNIRWRRSVAKSQRDFFGRVVSVSGITTDVTARKHAELELERSHEALRNYAAELEARTQQLRRLASDLTLAEQRAREQLARTLHDHLQQLIFSARLNIERALERPGDRALLERASHALGDAISSARSLSVELFPPVLHQRDLPEALKWLAESKTINYGIQVDTSICPDANVAEDDVRTLLFESVRELLFNAVKHAGVDRVSLSAAVDGSGALKITVSDSGVGFEPPGAGHVSHGGLGLVSIRERLELLGGSVDIDSAPGKGARITLRVMTARPAARSRPVAVPATTLPPAPVTASVDSRRPLRVLIADDHELVRAGLRELISEHPEFVVVGEAEDGAVAVALAAEHAPDVVIMDVSMPGMDGIAATRSIRKRSPQIQVFGLSTQGGEGKHAIVDAGASAFFSKSDGVIALLDHLRAMHRATPLEN